MTARINEAGLLPMQLLDTQTEKYKAEANAKFQARESPGTETGVSSHGKGRGRACQAAFTTIPLTGQVIHDHLSG